MKLKVKYAVLAVETDTKALTIKDVRDIAEDAFLHYNANVSVANLTPKQLEKLNVKFLN